MNAFVNVSLKDQRAQGAGDRSLLSAAIIRAQRTGNAPYGLKAIWAAEKSGDLSAVQKATSDFLAELNGGPVVTPPRTVNEAELWEASTTPSIPGDGIYRVSEDAWVVRIGSVNMPPLSKSELAKMAERAHYQAGAPYRDRAWYVDWITSLELETLPC